MKLRPCGCFVRHGRKIYWPHAAPPAEKHLSSFSCSASAPGSKLHLFNAPARPRRRARLPRVYYYIRTKTNEAKMHCRSAGPILYMARGHCQAGGSCGLPLAFFLTEVGEQIPGDCEQGLALKAQAGLLLEGERAAEDALGGAETGDRDLEMRYTGEGNFGAEEKETSAGSDGRGKVSRQPANRENRGRSWLLWGGPFQQSQP